MKGFKAYQIDTASGPFSAGGRRDCYAIYLLSGQRALQSTDRETEPDTTYLLVGNPSEGDSSHVLLAHQTGYACLFTEAFVQECGKVASQTPWSLLRTVGSIVFPLQCEQALYLTSLFQKMVAEQQSSYLFQHELLGSYLQLVLHEALRLHPTAPPCHFRYYFQCLASPGGLGTGWLRRRRRG
ncbi:hypothetical protein [Hymenobacter sp. DG01]|uniref:hypothetical protein n=1 Tax=Hymenobacter sp. DG01 TaxID=2584940 RepID=UPI00111CA871|nr:hypothetical protein [Hymenobacter sp. DG01]